MRSPDGKTADGGCAVWRVPIGRVGEWVRTHPERVHQASREFAHLWRDLWYVRLWVSGGDVDDEIAVERWAAVSLRDLRQSPDFPRLYREAEWKLCAEWCSHTPPVNGDGLYDQTGEEPILLYQFHGLSEQRVLSIPFTTYGVDMLAAGLGREDAIMAAMLSRMVNECRALDGLRPLLTGERSGLLVELEDGSFVSPEVLA